MSQIEVLKSISSVPPVLPPSLNSSIRQECASDVGILAIEYYAPSLCVRAEDIENFHGSPGRYTKGRGQEAITFCSDDEDAVSMAMTSFHRLMTRCDLSYDEIGRLEVGTESQVDRAKSIKTFLMSFFNDHGVYNVEGTDTYNACYGGTNALLSTINWIESAGWNGKYGIVVCTDPAVHPDPAHLSSIGAASVAMLVGPRAPLVLEPKRVSFIKHAWDFYRPIGWHNNDAIMDLDTATSQYEEALQWCQDQFSEALGTSDLLSEFQFVAFHNNAPYHSKRNLRFMAARMYGDGLSKDDQEQLYRKHVEAGTAISAENATTYTCTLYASILSLVVMVGEALPGNRVLCFSYGSGCAASM